MSEYPSYLIHYGTPGQKWGVRNYQNKDGTWTEEGLRRRREQFISETKDTAHKIAGIIAGHHSDKDLSQKEMRQLVNKYKNYKPIKNKDGTYSDEYRELVRKNNKRSDSDGSKEGRKLYEWERFEEDIVKDPKDLYKEKAIRKDRLKDVYKIIDEEAETRLSDINRKINTYNKAIETYLNSSIIKKNMKELDVEFKDIYNENDYKTDHYDPGDSVKVLGFKTYKNDDINERIRKFRQQYGY